jgi:hypothetical protein
MTSEHVALVLDRTDAAKPPRLHVTVVFQMTNRGGDTTLEEGIPVGPIADIEGFALQVDAAPVECRLVDCARPTAEGGDRPSRQDLWYVWNTVYKAGQERTHVVSYSIPAHEHQIPPHRCYHTGYLLHTGAPWKKRIRSAKVTLRLGEGIGAEDLSFSPRVAGQGEGWWRWTFQNFEPTRAEDIGIIVDPDRQVCRRERAGSQRVWETAR